MRVLQQDAIVLGKFDFILIFIEKFLNLLLTKVNLYGNIHIVRRGHRKNESTLF